jgi:hypothetical protein
MTPAIPCTKPADDIAPTGDGVLSIPWQKPPFKRFRSSCLMACREKMSGQSGQNDAYGSSAPSLAAGAGWTKSSLDPFPASPRSRCASDVRRFVEEADRGQWTLLPECLDDFIDESNPVRVINAFVDALDLAEMSFEGVEPAATGRSRAPNVNR